MRPVHRRTLLGGIPAAVVLLAVEPIASGARARGDRVATARRRVTGALRERFAARGLAYPPKHLYLRVFKRERRLEMWSEAGDGRFVLVKSYGVCASSGRLGPKRTQGDEQVPEGFYEVRVFNPKSRFHLSLGIDYPNRSDRALGRSPFGRDIMIHGGCATIGCVPIGDDAIEEVYVAARDARPERAVVVHIFPAVMTDAATQLLRKEAGADARLRRFWESLRPAYLRFEATRRLPRTRFDAGSGLYVVER
jgi:murein L,D-transpeptidase YafK